MQPSVQPSVQPKILVALSFLHLVIILYFITQPSFFGCTQISSSVALLNAFLMNPFCLPYSA